MSVLMTREAIHQTGPLVKLHDGSVVGFIEVVVTVVSSGGNKYALDGSTQGVLTIEQGKNYYFNVSDSSNGSHPLQFSTTSDGTHGGGSAYTTGVTTSGTAGTADAYVLLETDSSTPSTLYYYCSSHPGMGGSAFKNTFSSHSVDASVVSKDDKVGIGTVAAGATISHKLDINGDIRVRGNNIRDNSGNAAITFDGSANTQIDGTLTVAAGNTVTINGVTYTFPASDGTSGQFLSTNGGGTLSFATASGGGGSDTFVMKQPFEQYASMSSNNYYYKSGQNSNLWNTLISITNFGTLTYRQLLDDAACGVVPVAANLTSYHIVGTKFGSDNDTITLRFWKLPAPANDSAGTDTPTNTQLFSVSVAVDHTKNFNYSGTLSSGNSFAAGDLWFMTMDSTAYMTSDHGGQISLVFEPT